MKIYAQLSVVPFALTLALVGTAGTQGCSPPMEGGGSGGAVGVGGTGPGSGGAAPGSGGAVGVGGANPGSGGYVSTGGGTATGGGSATGGAVNGTGGAGTGGAGTGGETAGTGGSAPGGEGNLAGDPDPSPGCGQADPTDCLPCTASGRDYYVDMPNDYDPNTPYPVIFKYHPLGGSATGARNMYLGVNDFDAIYVSQEGSDNGFPNGGNVDETMTREIMEDIEARLCVDRARYFATGFSYGGSMSYTAACDMADKFRAVAAMAGSFVSAASCANQTPVRPVAVLGIHGEEDTVLTIDGGEGLVGPIIDNNGCTRETEPSPILDSECVKSDPETELEAGSYVGCQPGYPVIWCPIPGYGHNMPQWSREAITAFFEMF